MFWRNICLIFKWQLSIIETSNYKNTTAAAALCHRKSGFSRKQNSRTEIKGLQLVFIKTDSSIFFCWLILGRFCSHLKPDENLILVDSLMATIPTDDGMIRITFEEMGAFLGSDEEMLKQEHRETFGPFLKKCQYSL